MAVRSRRTGFMAICCRLSVANNDATQLKLTSGKHRCAPGRYPLRGAPQRSAARARVGYRIVVGGPVVHRYCCGAVAMAADNGGSQGRQTWKITFIVSFKSLAR